ncbi:MAG: GT4 family glycosyltransferase PelF [bacterium]
MTNQTDICLLLEGTYPFVAGGVSSWVHSLVTSLNEYTFSLAVILPDQTTAREYKYSIPENIKEIRPIFLHDLQLPHEHQNRLQKQAWHEIDEFHFCPVNSNKYELFESIFHNFFNANTRGLAPEQMADHKQAWEILSRLYREKAPDASFIDYFWTYRFIHYPIFKILISELPPARVYHTVSTGYAGLLGVAAKLKYQRPLILTEHGIYTRERRIEISRADWIYEKDRQQMKVRKSQSRFKDLWNRMFTSLSRLCYEYSDVIITLFSGNQKYQMEDGADPGKSLIIANGIDIEQFKNLKRAPKADSKEFVIGFMGRVVSIKDVKTFIRACKAVADVVPKLKVYVMGPTDEEESYYEECVQLTAFLGLKNILQFTGKVDVCEYYPKIDLLVLTSISEAQPLVILEANCMGIPVVATDVGACRELLYGSTEEDRALGKSGLIAGITNADEIARAIIRIWKSKDLRTKMGQVGKRRVAQFYNKSDLDNQYRKLYRQFIGIDEETIAQSETISSYELTQSG